MLAGGSPFGRRRELAQYLIDNSAPTLLAKIAGQALNPWTARGLGRLGTEIGLGIAGGLGGIHGGLSGGLIGMAAIAPFMSPRLMGLSAYGLGRAARFGNYGVPLYQYGRVGETSGVQ